MNKKIVLGYPYEGAFYWLISAEDWRDSSIKSSYEGSHPYYRTLYGKNPGQFVDQTASICILYDDIYLAPADCYLPDNKKYLKGRKYHNKKIGLHTDWDWYPKDDYFENHSDYLVREISKTKLPQRVPDNAKKQIIRGLLIQLNVANEQNADIIGNKAYVRLCEFVKDRSYCMTK